MPAIKSHRGAIHNQIAAHYGKTHLDLIKYNSGEIELDIQLRKIVVCNQKSWTDTNVMCVGILFDHFDSVDTALIHLQNFHSKIIHKRTLKLYLRRTRNKVIEHFNSCANCQSSFRKAFR